MRRLLLPSAVAIVLSAVVAVSVSLASGAADSAETHWVTTDLGTLGGRGSVARDVNDRGQVIGTSRTPSGQVSVFLWRPGTRMMTRLGAIDVWSDWNHGLQLNERSEVIWPARDGTTYRWKDGVTRRVPIFTRTNLPTAVAHALSDRGQIAGTAVGGGAVLWQDGRVRDLGVLPGDDGSGASAISENGVVVGFSVRRNGARVTRERLFAWKDGKMRHLGASACGARYQSVVAISDNGQVVGICGKSTVLWRSWNATGRTILGASHGFLPLDLNDRGQILGRCDDDGQAGYEHSCVWENGNVLGMGTLGGKFATPIAMNNRGEVIGMSKNKAGRDHAFVWSNGVMTDLTAGSSNLHPEAINDRGQIVGWRGTHDAGGTVSHAILWTRTSS